MLRGELEARNLDYEFDFSRKFRGSPTVLNLGRTDSSKEMTSFFVKMKGGSGAGIKLLSPLGEFSWNFPYIFFDFSQLKRFFNVQREISRVIFHEFSKKFWFFWEISLTFRRKLQRGWRRGTPGRRLLPAHCRWDKRKISISYCRRQSPRRKENTAASGRWGELSPKFLRFFFEISLNLFWVNSCKQAKIILFYYFCNILFLCFYNVVDSQIQLIPHEFSPKFQVLSRGTLLDQIIVALQRTCYDGRFILKICSSHCRFTVGLIWVLAQLFETVRFTRPKLCSPLSSDRYELSANFL